MRRKISDDRDARATALELAIFRTGTVKTFPDGEAVVRLADAYLEYIEGPRYDPAVPPALADLRRPEPIDIEEPEYDHVERRR